MSSTSHYREQIERATSRLAQLQARELLASQRREAKNNAIKRREASLRRRRIADLVFSVGAQDLSDEAIVAALQNQMNGLEGGSQYH